MLCYLSDRLLSSPQEKEPCYVTKTHCSRGGAESLPRGVIVETSDLQFRSLKDEEENEVGTTCAVVWQRDFVSTGHGFNALVCVLVQLRRVSFLTLVISFRGSNLWLLLAPLICGLSFLCIVFQVEEVMPKNLLVMTVGIKQKKVVDEIVQKVCFSQSLHL